MIHSAVVSFACLGFRWTLDLTTLAEVQNLNLDRAVANMPAIVLGVFDGLGRPVHPRYFQPFLQGANTRALIFDAAARGLVKGCQRILVGSGGDVVTEPELETDPQAALDRYLGVNGSASSGTG